MQKRSIALFLGFICALGLAQTPTFAQGDGCAISVKFASPYSLNTKGH